MNYRDRARPRDPRKIPSWVPPLIIERRSCSKPILESQLDLLSSGTFSDVTFIVGPSKERISCHKLFLAARSPVFEVMLSERWTQDNNREILIEDMDSVTFKKFLQFIYADTFVTTTTVRDALELLQVAHRYDVQILVTKCEELLLGIQVPLKDALDVFAVARKYEKIQLMNKAGDLMAQSMSAFQCLPSFSRLDKETLVYLLERNCLKVKEVDVFRLAVKWAENQSKLTMEQSLEDILPLIRFPVITREEFTTVVVPTGLLSQSSLDQLYTYFRTDAKTKKSLASTFEFNTQRRRSTHSAHYVDLYAGENPRQKTIHLQHAGFQDCLQFSTQIVGTTAMGINGIHLYCPAREGSATIRTVSGTFKEFEVCLKLGRRRTESRGLCYDNILRMSPVRAEEGKMTEIKFDDVVPLENKANYRITVVELQPRRSQLAATMMEKDQYVANVFCRIRNCYLGLNIINGSVVIEGERRKEAKRQRLDDAHEYPQLICRFGLEAL